MSTDQNATPLPHVNIYSATVECKDSDGHVCAIATKMHGKPWLVFGSEASAKEALRDLGTIR